MTVTAVPGSPFILVGPGQYSSVTGPLAGSTLIDAAKEAHIAIGYAVTSDGGSHTIDTSGSSSIGWRSGAVTFANAGTTFKVGIGTIDTATGPPARATNVTDVITFDVAASLTGGGGGVTANAWQTSVPTTGTKAIANGDLIAVSWQMTALGGADTIQVSASVTNTSPHRPAATAYTGGSYATSLSLPNVFITFSDGATCYLQGSELFSTINTRTWNSGSSPAEYGQLYNLPFPYKVYGIYGRLDPDADCDIVLYSAPLGTPVAQKTISIDTNVVSAGSPRPFNVFFDAPVSVAANTAVGAVFKPGASSVSALYRTLNAAGHRVADVWGTSGYGISRSSGAFADTNSSLDHYYIGLIAGAFDDGASSGLACNPLGGFVV